MANKLNEALNRVSIFLKNLTFVNATIDYLSGFTFFSDPGLGGVTLDGEDLREYVKCLDGLAESVAREESFSRRGVEKLLQTAILKAVDGRSDRDRVPEEKIKAAVKWLRGAMSAEPRTYHIYLPVTGIDPAK